MPYIHKNGNQFGLADISINMGVSCREITQARYNELSDEEKNDGTVYFVTDGQPNALYINDPSPIGAILAYGGTEAPNGWLICDGSAVNRIVYKDLFAVIGTTYGEGDGVTSFNLPNLKGRVAIGADNGYVLGTEGGEAAHTLTAEEMPSHRHWISAGLYDDGNMSSTGNANTQDNGLVADAGTYSESDTCKTYGRYDAWAGGSNGASGKGVSQGTTTEHNNMQPYVVTNYIIKVHDAYRAGGSGGGGSVDSTAVPAPNMVSEFDDNAKMNSTDMTDAEIESYFDTITYNPLIVNDTVPIGAIQAYGGATAPNNWLICDGSAVSRTTYNKLFAAIGTTYGTGDGSTTFNLPDLRGNVAIGSNETYTLGTSGGEAEHALVQTEIPNMFWHTNNIPGDNLDLSFNGGTNYGMHANASIGEGDAHNNMQPYIVTNYIIKANDNEVTGGQLQALTDFFYPIGSYYETSDATFNPNVSFGGTWISEEAADDYIIDEGTEDIWTFRKWASGIAECWGMWTTTTSNFFDWNNLARGYVGPVDFPNELFSETPVIMKKSATTSNAIMAEGNEHAAYGGGLPSKTNTGGMTLYSGDKTNYIGASFPITMKYYARGVWKTLDIDAKFKWHRTA